MISEKNRFYLERDRRSLDYGVSDSIFDRPIAVTADDETAESEHGQMMILSLVNMLSRLHRKIYFAVPDAPILAKKAMFKMKQCSMLHEAIDVVATSIDPYVNVLIGIKSDFQAGIGIGKEYIHTMPWYIGTDSNTVFFDRSPVDIITPMNEFSLGACAVPCIAASALMKQLLNMNLKTTKMSAWNLKEGELIESGPQLLGPLDVGNVFMIGAGGVGSCLVYWLRQSGLTGQWTIVDGDQAELHNTNRCMGMIASDAGWPANQPGYKAEIAAKLTESSYCNKWYDDIVEDACKADLILPLANEYGVRNKISQRGDNIILHATTSVNWEAQLHRHIAGRDDCVVCRMPQGSVLPNFKCSTVKMPGNPQDHNDAALPFLSSAAGFLLLNGLYRLMYGVLDKDINNWWRMIFNSSANTMASGKCKCALNCSILLPEPTRKKVNSGKRWAHIK